MDAKEARAIWTTLIRPVASDLGFRPGKTVMRGWVRESTPIRATFWFQVTQFGFDRHTGGKFIVEFTASDRDRRTAMRDRLWSLLDEGSQQKVIRLNKEVVLALPGPSSAILESLPEWLRDAYMKTFKPVDSIPATNQDVWFRYAARADAERWGQFVAAKLADAVRECERRLAAVPPGMASMFGTRVSLPG